jgi:dipeptidyl aminopeptidase/acylaminoacyl peptidase
MDRFLILCLALAFVFAAPALAADGRRAMKLEDLYALKRLSDPAISPDGKHVAYTLTSVDLEANSSTSSIWLAATDGKTPARQLTTNKKDRHPRWSPDGKQLAFESSRSGSPQIWVIALDGGEARQLTEISSGASGPVWSPDGKTIAFTSAVFPEFSDKPFKEADAANKKRQEEIDKSPVKAKVFTKLFYRHWDSYVEDKRQHVFVIPAAGGEPLNLTPGDRDAVPTSSTFSAGDDYCFSPDGQQVIYTATPEDGEAWSTNMDLMRVSVKGGKPETLSSENKAADNAPRFSPDGKKFAYRAQKKPGYEADKWDVMLVEVDASGKWTGKPKNLTADVDISVEDLVWTGKDTLTITLADKGSTVLGTLSLATGKLEKSGEGMITGVSSSSDGKVIAFAQSRMTRPNEVFARHGGDKPVQLTQANEKLLAQLDLPAPESVTVKGAGGTPMQMWILKPPGFDATKKYPVAYLVHGGPQGAWEDGWSFRWCPSLWAARGYVVALPNPRGSTGFGQKYTDEITGDWGGKCYEDLMKGADYVEALPYVDKTRIGSAGASFGGYMMNWFAVNTGRFKCLISHCSVWNFDSMYGTTDELWFDEWEHGGPPWGKNRESYEKHSPQRLAGNLGKFKTPMLVIHNDLDFRCPIGQGHELFTALQRQKVPSRFVNFPDEGHWVLKPKNGERWHKEAFGWLEKYVAPGGK